jgi:hypothetical protein
VHQQLKEIEKIVGGQKQKQHAPAVELGGAFLTKHVLDDAAKVRHNKCKIRTLIII